MVSSYYCSRDPQESSPAPQFETISSLVFSLLYGPTLTFTCDYWKNHSFDYTSLLFNMLSGFVIAFLSRSKRLLLSWLQSSSAVILELKKIKSVTVVVFTWRKITEPFIWWVHLSIWVVYFSQKVKHGTSLVVQWLRICLLVQGGRGQSLVGKVGSQMPHGQNTTT